MSQYEIILKAMLNNKNKVWWTASDFQQGDHFVGYEATARMSELLNKHSNIIIPGKEGRFRTLSIDWNKEKEIKEIKEFLELGVE